MPVCAAARGPVSAAADTDARRWTAPALALGCQAMFWPPVGSATRSNRRCALPPSIRPPGGAHGRHRRRCALPVPLIPATPAPPLRGLCGSLRSCVSGCAAPATRLSCRTGVLSTWYGCLSPLRASSSCKALHCNAAGLLRQGLASQRAPAGRPPQSGRQRGQEGVLGGLGAGRRGMGVGWRAAWWQRAPTPLAGRCAPL